MVLGFRVRRRVSLALSALLFAIGQGVLAAPSQAAPPALGGRLFGIGEAVTVEVLQAESGFTSEIWLVKPTRVLVGTDDATGTVARLGRVTAGTEIVFAIEVLDTGDTFYTGPATRNPDGLSHAWVSDNGDGSYDVRVGLEDLFGGGDGDHNDVVFRVSGVAQQLVTVDVRPDSSGNAVNTRAHGVVPLAVLSTTMFSARALDPLSICFGSAARPLGGDCTERHGRGHLADVNGDRLVDLVCTSTSRSSACGPATPEPAWSAGPEAELRSSAAHDPRPVSRSGSRADATRQAAVLRPDACFTLPWPQCWARPVAVQRDG